MLQHKIQNQNVENIPSANATANNQTGDFQTFNQFAILFFSISSRKIVHSNAATTQRHPHFDYVYREYLPLLFKTDKALPFYVQTL